MATDAAVVAEAGVAAAIDCAVAADVYVGAGAEGAATDGAYAGADAVVAAVDGVGVADGTGLEVLAGALVKVLVGATGTGSSCG